jgi:hypothetical protein
MANIFKNAAVADVNVSYDTLYTCPPATTAVVLGLAIANKNGVSVSGSVQFSDSSAVTDYQLLEGILIPSNTTLEALEGQKYILESGDALKVKASIASSLDVILGIMEIS